METRRAASHLGKANNGAPGIAGVTCEALEASGGEPWRAPSRDALVARTSPPMRGRRQARPQEGGTQVRVLGMPTIRDRVGQGALPLSLAPMFAAEFQPGSYGYRPKRSAHAAVERVAEAIASRKTRGIDVDLHAYCDNVRPHVLLAKVATRGHDADVLHLFQGLLQASGSTGVPQGGVRSPWLSHLDLTEVERMLERAQEGTRSGPYPYRASARCADDMGSCVEAHRRHDGRLQAVEQRLREALAVLHVTINAEKSRTVDLARGATFSFLGCDFRRVKSQRGAWRPWSTPRRKKRTVLLGKLQERCRRHASQPVERVRGLITPILRGWVRSLAVGDSHRCFGFIKDWVDKKVRRHLMRARNRKGLGWQRGRRRGLEDALRLCHNDRVSRPQPKALPGREVPEPCTRTQQESAVRENRTLRLTWRELETWPWWNCAPTEPSKELVWKPST